MTTPDMTPDPANVPEQPVTATPEVAAASEQSTEKKKPNRFQISRESQEEFVNSIAETMAELAAQGKEWVKPWTSDTPMGFPFNPSTGREYSGANMIRLMLTSLTKGYQDDRWVTYKQLEAYKEEHPDENIYIRKGEHGTRILRPEELVYTVEEDGRWKYLSQDELKRHIEDMRLGKPVPEVQKVILYYPHTVFNGSQIEGFPKKEKQEHNQTPIERNEFLEKFIASSGVPVNHHAGEAYYDHDTDSVQLPYKERFISTEEYYATKMHEFFHATGSPAREDRLKSKDTKAYALEEMRAEMFSVLAGAHLDLPVPVTNSAAYVGHWNQRFSGGDAKEVFRAATEASKILTVLRDYDAGEQPRASWFPKRDEWPQLIEKQAARDRATANPEALAQGERPAKALNNLPPSAPELSREAFLRGENLITRLKVMLRNPELLEKALQNDPQAARSLEETLDSLAKKLSQPEARDMTIEAQAARVESRIAEQQQAPERQAKPGKNYLYVPFEEKDAAKAAGARWDNGAGKWYAPEGADMEKLAQWQQPPTSAASQNQSDSQRMRM